MEKENRAKINAISSNDDIIPCFDHEKDNNLSISLKKVHENPDCIVISLLGYIDTYNAPFFQKQVDRIIESGFKNLIFDCAKLTYLSSIGIGSFMLFFKALQPKGNIVLLQLQPKVFEVFDLLGYSRFFAIKNSVEEAVRFFADLEAKAASQKVFPKAFLCPICSKKLEAPEPGRFRCSGCKTVLDIDSEGQVFMG